MAQLVLGAAGAAAGFMIGGPAGASIGWTAGVMLGGALDPQNTQTTGPRLTDLKVQSSAYGGMKPVIYGAMRTNGNVIFCTDKREVATSTTDSAGKGGPTVTNTTYTYNVDIAIALCANQIAGIRKIWNNGLLIYDQSSGADIGTVIASTTTSKGFKVYLGSETQLPDPTIEATLGVGNVPGYRGTAYVVFTQLDCPNGQIPQLSFEVVTSVNATLNAPLYATVPYSLTQPVANKKGLYSVYDGQAKTYFNGPGYSTVGKPMIFDNGGAATTWTPRAVQSSPSVSARVVRSIFYTGVVGSYAVENIVMHDLDAGGPQTLLCSWTANVSTDVVRVEIAAFDKVSGAYVVSGSSITTSYSYPRIISPGNAGNPVAVDTAWPGNNQGGLAFYNGIVYGQYLDGSNRVCLRQWDTSGHYIGDIVGPVITIPVSGNWPFGCLQVDENGIYVATFAAGFFGGQGTLYVHKYAGGAWVQLAAYPDPAQKFEEAAAARGVQFYCTDNYLVMASRLQSPNTSAYLLQFAGIAPTDVTVSTIITDVCARAGLPSTQLDTSSLTDTVTGYALTQVSPARANLLPIQQYGFIDGIESDGLLKWTPRAARVSVATIAWDELATEQDGTAPGDPMALQRTQEADLPRSVALNYLNTAADYQSGTETSRRIITGSVNDIVAQLPVATTAARAAQAADVQLYDAWNERNQRSVKLSRKYAFLDAGDVITVEYPQGTYSAKRITSANDTGLLIELTLVDSDAAIYTPTASGASPAQAQIGVTLSPPTALQLLDIPILRDADNNPGLYVGLAGYATPWPGAVLYMGPDDASLAPRGGVTQATVIGYADSALGNWTSLVMDQSNSMLVTIGAGTLSSAARDAVFDTGANLAAIGAPGRWEIIAFTTATLVAGTQYQLSGLLRGLYGTEAQTGLHAIGDAFVLLQFAGLLRPNFDLSELNQPRQFRAITTGQSINTAGSTTAADTGVGLKPYNPVNLRRSTDAGNNITLTWDRRTRSSVDFPANGVDVPLFETVESYSIDVYSSNTFTTIVRTIAASNASAAYTAAQQTTDGLTPGAAVNVRVYQIGAAGRGYPLQGTK